MKAMDKIIGYAGIKNELRQIGDILKNREAYDRLGISSPHGLLLYGAPGVGKSLMAAAVIEESGRPAFTCRKDQPNGDFIKQIKETFDSAVHSAPSIVFLDDMDKFANGDERHPNSEEYVTVQSCIDEVKGKEVFVLATVNDLDRLPESLCRVGRFDRRIEVEAPRGKDAERIVGHYLKGKRFVGDVDAKAIARILDGYSCAMLETVINEAGLYAGYERAEAITMDHILEACMRTVFEVLPEAIDEEDPDECATLRGSEDFPLQIAYHEAGHAVVSEILCPESVTLVCAFLHNSSMGGFASYYKERSTAPMYWRKSRIVASLGGMAAVEQVFGVFDAGNTDDLDQAFDTAKSLVVSHCVCGLHLHRNECEDSQQLWAAQEQVVAGEVERYYKKAKEILACNAEFLRSVAEALMKKGVLVMSEIKAIKERCAIVPVTL